MTTTDAELIATVNAHLKLVDASCFYKSDEATLRVVTASLRNLLADNSLANAWKASGIGGPMIFDVWSIASTGPGKVVAFCGGGDILPNTPFSACRNAKLERKSIDLKTFCSSARIQVDNVRISTVELVRFVANVLGGVHFDLDGKSAKKAKAKILSKILSGEIQGVPVKPNDRNLLHHEILSIAQAVVRSPQVVQLRQWRQ